MKLTKRKGFNFYRSYFDVYNELDDKDKLAFIEALLNRQFLGIKPENLKGMAKFAYISQTDNIDRQVKGYEDKTGDILDPRQGGATTPNKGGYKPPRQQEKGKEEVKEKEKEKNNIPVFSDFLEYGLSKQKDVDRDALKLKYESWIENGWKDGNDKIIKNWKAKLLNTLPYVKKNEKPDPFKNNAF